MGTLKFSSHDQTKTRRSMAVHDQQSRTRHQQPPVDPKIRAEKLENRIKLMNAALGLMTAIATAFGAVWGVTAKKASTAEGKADTSQQQVQALQNENEALKKRIVELEQQATPTSSPGPLPSTGIETPLVRHEGRVTMIRGAHVDLDTAPDDPQWGMTRLGVGGFDLVFTGNDLDPDLDTQVVTSTAAATYEACHNAQGYNTDRLPLSVLKDTRTLCVMTHSGRQAALAVKYVSATKLEFQATTYGN